MSKFCIVLISPQSILAGSAYATVIALTLSGKQGYFISLHYVQYFHVTVHFTFVWL